MGVRPDEAACSTTTGHQQTFLRELGNRPTHCVSADPPCFCQRGFGGETFTGLEFSTRYAIPKQVCRSLGEGPAVVAGEVHGRLLHDRVLG